MRREKYPSDGASKRGSVKMTFTEMAILCITASEGNWLRSAVQLAVLVKPP
jgi:hypothetical protein